MNDNNWTTEIVFKLVLSGADNEELSLHVPGLIPTDVSDFVHLKDDFYMKIYSRHVYPSARLLRVFLTPYYCEGQEQQDDMKQELMAAGWEEWKDS